MTKTGSRDENIDCWQNLLHFYFPTSEKWHFWQQNPLEAVYRNKHWILDGEKIAKFEICGKRFDKVCTYWQTRKK